MQMAENASTEDLQKSHSARLYTTASIEDEECKRLDLSSTGRPPKCVRITLMPLYKHVIPITYEKYMDLNLR